MHNPFSSAQRDDEQRPVPTALAELREHPKSIEIQQYLSEKLTPKRYTHVLAVQETAVALAQRHDADISKANLAALLHDVAKWMNKTQLYTAVADYQIQLDAIERITPALLHPIIGVKLAIERFDITNLEVLEAIRNHTTGNASMGLIAQVVYVADFIEPTRIHEGVTHVRELAETDLSLAVHHVARYKIVHLLQEGRIIHPNTLHTYNSTLAE